MAWRPSNYLIEGELDNSPLGKVTGWMRFRQLDAPVTFDLAGDFHRDIRGASVRLRGHGADYDHAEPDYMQGFAQHQTGKVGDITAGLPPRDYVSYPYIEWYGEENGRVVIELDADQIEVVGTPLPFSECEPVSRETQGRNLAGFLVETAKDLSQERNPKNSRNGK